MPEQAPATVPSSGKISIEAGDAAAVPLPAWADTLRDLYYSGTISSFVLHGNAQDHIEVRADGSGRYGSLLDFLAERIFGTWDLVFHFDLARGLRLYAGRDGKRQADMVRRFPEDLRGARDPDTALRVLNQVVNTNVMHGPDKRMSIAVLIEHASYVFPQAEPGRLPPTSASHLLSFLNWAASPQVKALNMAFVAIEDRLVDLNDRLTSSPHVATLEMPLPGGSDRSRFIEWLAGTGRLPAFADGLSEDTFTTLAAGLSLVDIEVLARTAQANGEPLNVRGIGERKKRLIEKKCQGLIEFVEPKWGLGAVVGHAAAKTRLREDAQLLAAGALDALPMGYLVCGPVGTGKTFIVQCAASEMNAPCVVFKNFRSKYVGESEGNLERVLSVLRAMGPVIVVIDEADAALGDRDASGDSGTSQRIFSMIAAQMGDTRFRGRIIWTLLTARPDRLPVDLKRQGRAEVHIPLFYPESQDDIAQMFAVMAKKLGAEIEPSDLPVLEWGELSGADIEGILGRAQRRVLLEGRPLTGSDIEAAFRDFMPSVEGGKKSRQRIAAILECTDRSFLPPSIAAWVDEQGGREALAARFDA